jgi:hypothetical protein
MAKRRKNKRQPKQAQFPPPSKAVKQTEDPNNSDRQTVAWRISEFDYGGPWGDRALNGQDLQDIVRGWAHSFETQKWGDLLGASGGRKAGNNHHPIDVGDLSKSAQKRLEAIHKDDLVDSIFSFRVKGTTRIYGIRDGRVFNVLWFDPWHGDQKKAACPSKKRNT